MVFSMPEIFGNPNYSNGITLGADGLIYGNVNDGGSFDGARDGFVFSYDPVSDEYKIVSNFTESGIGARPEFRLLRASNDKLYGIAKNG